MEISAQENSTHAYEEMSYSRDPQRVGGYLSVIISNTAPNVEAATITNTYCKHNVKRSNEFGLMRSCRGTNSTNPKTPTPYRRGKARTLLAVFDELDLYLNIGRFPYVLLKSKKTKQNRTTIYVILALYRVLSSISMVASGVL